MSWKTDVIKALATIQADTKNHKEDLFEFKEDFKAHKEEESKETFRILKKVDKIQCDINDLECPHNEKFHRFELQQEEKEKEDAIDRVKNGERIARLETARKYNYAGLGVLYVLAGIALKKLFS